METETEQRPRSGRDKTTQAHVRKVRGGFIVTYRLPKPRQNPNQAASLAAALVGGGDYEDREVVCTELAEVNSLLVELLGDDA